MYVKTNSSAIVKVSVDMMPVLSFGDCCIMFNGLKCCYEIFNFFGTFGKITGRSLIFFCISTLAVIQA